jgi:hypothetical protein
MENNVMLAGIPLKAGGVSWHRLGARSVSGHWLQNREVRCEMKGRLAAFVGIFCIAILIVSGANADKPPKPPKPPQPGETTAECITFTGDLNGRQQVEGCCPNAGPYPVYTMILNNLGWLDGTYEGQLFMNYHGAGRNKKYIVQFWNDDLGIAIEIIGGVIVNDRKNKVLTVTFEDETGWDLINDIPIPDVDFVLVRTSDLTDCPAP